MVSEPDTDDAAAAAAARIEARYRGQIPAARARAAFNDAYRALRSKARVLSFLPLLAERAAASTIDELLKQTADDPSSSLTVTPGRSVTFRGAASRWKTDVETASAGRWTCVDERADFVVVGCGTDGWAPDEIVLVADARERPPSHEVATALNQGAAAYVCRADPSLILAHLEALARRPITSPPLDAHD